MFDKTTVTHDKQCLSWVTVIFVISFYNLLHFKNINIFSLTCANDLEACWEKCARLEQMHTEYAGREVSGMQTAQVHKVYSVATHLDQNLACVEIGYSYQILNTVKYSILITHSCQFRTRTWCVYMQSQTPMTMAKAKTNKAKALTN